MPRFFGHIVPTRDFTALVSSGVSVDRLVRQKRLTIPNRF